MEGEQHLTDKQVEDLLAISGKEYPGLRRDQREYVLGQILNRADAYTDEARDVTEAIKLDKLRRIPIFGSLVVALRLMQTRKK